MKALGIDIGGSRVKSAVVDVHAGITATKRKRIDTPEPATPEAILQVCAEVIEPFGDISPIGVGYPGVIRDGVVHTAHNLDPSWIGYPIDKEFSRVLGRPVHALNDADAAGLAEIRHGEGKNIDGVVVLLTVGTGLGSALFFDGKLVPNSELGRLYFGRKQEAEEYVSDRARDKDNLSEKAWADRMEEVLTMVESLFWPTRIIIGGGGAKNLKDVMDRIHTRAEVRHAKAKNKAGIIGAAIWAAEYQRP